MGIQDTLKALADPIRREILNLLKNGRLSAGEICEHFSVTGASISRHLAILKEADLIRNQREGKFIYYELNTSVLEDVMLWITDLKGASNLSLIHISEPTRQAEISYAVFCLKKKKQKIRKKKKKNKMVIS